MERNAADILLIDKPKGITSFDVIRLLRKKLGIRKMGHAGTLDPNATGLMIIACGDATKQLKDLLGLPKVYRAEILLGVETETGDIDGAVVHTEKVPEIDVSKSMSVLQSLVGEIDLPVPLYSAIKKNGKPLYAYAREKILVEVPIKKMKVVSATFISFTEHVISVEFAVGSGTYIRSLVVEIGKRLGTRATLKNLKRISIGEYTLDNAQVL